MKFNSILSAEMKYRDTNHYNRFVFYIGLRIDAHIALLVLKLVKAK